MEKLNGVQMTLPDVLPELTEEEESSTGTQTATEDASGRSALASKIKR